VTLSPYAAGLLRGARLGFAELDQAIEELHELRGERAGMLRIGSLPLPLGTVLPAALNRITADRPDIRISVRDSPYAGLLFALRNGDLDVILGALRTPDPAPDVEQEELFRDRLGIFCAPGHPLAGTTPDKAALSRCQWVVARDKTPTRVHFDRFFAQQGLVPAVESNSMLLVRLLLSGSDKLTMMSRTQVDEHLQSGALVELPIRLGDAPRPIGMTYRRDWQPTRAQAEFLHAARAAGAETAGRNRLWEY
jgi:DNA-binding transcriptional LysR family regulator